MTFPVPIANGATVVATSLPTTTVTFRNSAGVATDPTTITLKVQESGGAVTTYVYPNAFITRVNTGIYSAEIDTTGQSGPAIVEWIGTGAIQAISSAGWSAVPPPL